MRPEIAAFISVTTFPAVLKYSLLFWEVSEYCATGIVIVGAVGEYVAEFHKFPTDDIKRHKLQRLSAIVLIAGLAIELLALVRTTQLNSATNAQLYSEAQQARNEAASAERLERIKIEDRLKPRILNAEQQRRIESNLKAFSGTPYELAVDPVREAVNLLETIDAVLRSSGWLPKESGRKDLRFILRLSNGMKVEQDISTGVTIQLSKQMLAKYNRAVESLISELQMDGISAKGEMLPADDPSPDNVRIKVGTKE
jgi:hypothetical protein